MAILLGCGIPGLPRLSDMASSAPARGNVPASMFPEPQLRRRTTSMRRAKLSAHTSILAGRNTHFLMPGGTLPASTFQARWLARLGASIQPVRWWAFIAMPFPTTLRMVSWRSPTTRQNRSKTVGLASRRGGARPTTLGRRHDQGLHAVAARLANL